MNFLAYLNSEVNRICYLSATPIPEIFLDYIPQLKGIHQYILSWDPGVIREPILKERMMKKGESAESLCRNIIEKYRQTGHFERKIIDGNIVYSREACIFINEVRSIRNIIMETILNLMKSVYCVLKAKAQMFRKGFQSEIFVRTDIIRSTRLLHSVQRHLSREWIFILKMPVHIYL